MWESDFRATSAGHVEESASYMIIDHGHYMLEDGTNIIAGYNDFSIERLPLGINEDDVIFHQIVESSEIEEPVAGNDNPRFLAQHPEPTITPSKMVFVGYVFWPQGEYDINGVEMKIGKEPLFGASEVNLQF